jgi:hypothetical protein
MDFCTRFTVVALTRVGWFRTFETVPTLTPAWCATSLMLVDIRYKPPGRNLVCSKLREVMALML